MTVYLPIKERILARLVEILTAQLTGEATVRRWDGNGDAQPVHLDVLVVSEDEELVEEAMGGTFSVTTWRLPVIIGPVLMVGANSSNADTLRNVWAGKVEKAVMSDRNVTESGGPRLALDCAVESIEVPKYLEGVIESALLLEVYYQTYGNASTKGPGVTQVEYGG